MKVSTWTTCWCYPRGRIAHQWLIRADPTTVPKTCALTYDWNVGDGNTGNGVNPSHTYTAGGGYPVTLVVNDGAYNSEPVNTTAIITGVNDAPVADPGGTYDGTEGLPVIFDDSGSSDAEGSGLTYAWDFGHNADGTGVKPNHVYTAPGLYTVTFVVNDGTDNSSSVNTADTITEVNDARVAVGEDYSTGENTPLVVAASGVLDNDTDVDGDSLRAALDTEPSHNGLTLNTGCSFTYTPDAN